MKLYVNNLKHTAYVYRLLCNCNKFYCLSSCIPPCTVIGKDGFNPFPTINRWSVIHRCEILSQSLVCSSWDAILCHCRYRLISILPFTILLQEWFLWSLSIRICLASDIVTMNEYCDYDSQLILFAFIFDCSLLPFY